MGMNLMPKTRITTIPSRDRDGNDRPQYRTTVPRPVVDMLDLEGKYVNWKVVDGSTIELCPCNEE
jgi:hypothetical protein